MQSAMELRNACLVAAPHDMNRFLHVAEYTVGCKPEWNYGMHVAGQPMGCKSAKELRHSCLVVARHEASFTLRRATYGM